MREMTIVIDLAEHSTKELEARLDVFEGMVDAHHPREREASCMSCPYLVPAGALIYWRCPCPLQPRET